MQNRRKIAHTPIEEAPPKNSVHSKPVPPVALRAGHASSGVPASLRLAGVVAGKANISRRFVSSAFHQRNNPLRSDFVTRKSGTKPSYNSRQPALCLAKWPVAKSAFGQRDQAAIVKFHRARRDPPTPAVKWQHEKGFLGISVRRNYQSEIIRRHEAPPMITTS